MTELVRCRPAGRWRAFTLFLTLVMVLGGCAGGGGAPVEEREVETRVRQPAREDSAGVQVYPLENPAVAELTAQARSAEAAGELPQATMFLERALRIQPRNPELLQQMAEVQLQRRDYQQALSFAVRSHDVGPRVGELCARNWRTIGLSRERLGDGRGAREAESRAEQCMVTPPPAL
jgi:tetratricopeptide (TPR) repeat protein